MLQLSSTERRHLRNERRSTSFLNLKHAKQLRTRSTICEGSRRLLMTSLGPLLSTNLIGGDDATTLLNSVLGAYFLPRLPNSKGFKLLDDFENDFILEYPKSWVGRGNSARKGLTISDYNTSDKLSVEILDLKSEEAPSREEIVRLTVLSTIVPGFQQGQSDDRLELPPSRFIKTSEADLFGKAYLYLTFPSETTTRSGYDVKRKNFAVAVLSGGQLYVCAASARIDQFDKSKEELLRHIVQSFQLR
ncbi:hypothetical protein CEUSTIGMA_g5089.t1 [Chlamydomonas eustigma]|uniref:PsbP C-terminal domain-containing protein n=1 Tax=Chlamydomonas eustigma TaxID=1157962 RepID=A0A250X3L2_9CHLO|nr:hypothetical protein CEUSTIGMA_g5089.t1 [Chlamydomonas eustigma]|eukprot:GAX77646.1 hypothetical protein CEUSTIGMA_g5089.t1 [Chlamydomonas eustigma]